MKGITIWAVTKSASFQREGEGVWGNQHDRFNNTRGQGQEHRDHQARNIYCLDGQTEAQKHAGTKMRAHS